MNETKQYKTAGGFRTALETRLQARAREEKTDLQRLRRQVAFDRLLARLFLEWSEGNVSMDAEGWIRYGVADSFRTSDEGYRSDAP